MPGAFIYFVDHQMMLFRMSISERTLRMKVDPFRGEAKKNENGQEGQFECALRELQEETCGVFSLAKNIEEYQLPKLTDIRENYYIIPIRTDIPMERIFEVFNDNRKALMNLKRENGPTLSTKDITVIDEYTESLGLFVFKFLPNGNADVGDDVELASLGRKICKLFKSKFPGNNPFSTAFVLAERKFELFSKSMDGYEIIEDIEDPLQSKRSESRSESYLHSVTKDDQSTALAETLIEKMKKYPQDLEDFVIDKLSLLQGDEGLATTLLLLANKVVSVAPRTENNSELDLIDQLSTLNLKE